MKSTNWGWAIGIIVAFIFLGGAREIIFVNINEQIEFHNGRIANYRVLDYLSFLNDYDVVQLNRTKWILTLAFAAVSFLLSLLAVRYVMRMKKAIRWLVMLYIIGVAVAGLCYVAGKLFNAPQLGYTVSRKVMGALQSPFPLMLLIPALYLDPENKILT